MKTVVSKEELNFLSKIKGEVRGIGLKVTSEFVLREEGEKGLNLLQKTMAELGESVDYKKVRATSLYSLKTDALSFLVASRLFNFDDKKIRELGMSLVITPFALRLFTKYLVSFKVLAKAVSKIWEQAYPIGKLELVNVNLKEKHLTLHLKNFDVLPIYCQLFTGHFAKVLQMVLKKEVVCQETKCTFQGDSCHEFILKW